MNKREFILLLLLVIQTGLAIVIVSFLALAATVGVGYIFSNGSEEATAALTAIGPETTWLLLTGTIPALYIYGQAAAFLALVAYFVYLKKKEEQPEENDGISA